MNTRARPKLPDLKRQSQLLCSCDKAVEPTVSFRDLNKNDDKGHVADRASLRRDPIARMLEWSAK
jgi:hypothetical protein